MHVSPYSYWHIMYICMRMATINVLSMHWFTPLPPTLFAALAGNDVHSSLSSSVSSSSSSWSASSLSALSQPTAASYAQALWRPYTCLSTRISIASVSASAVKQQRGQALLVSAQTVVYRFVFIIRSHCSRLGEQNIGIHMHTRAHVYRHMTSTICLRARYWIWW